MNFIRRGLSEIVKFGSYGFKIIAIRPPLRYIDQGNSKFYIPGKKNAPLRLKEPPPTPKIKFTASKAEIYENLTLFFFFSVKKSILRNI